MERLIITTIAALMLASCGTDLTVHHEIEPIEITSEEATIDLPPEEEPTVVPVEELTPGLYTLSHWKMTYSGFTLGAEEAMNYLPFSSYTGELMVSEGTAEFTFRGLIGNTVIETRTDVWEYVGTEFVEEGVTQVYYRSGQLQVEDLTRSSVDKMWYEFRLVEEGA